jgi:hypothetical protein
MRGVLAAAGMFLCAEASYAAVAIERMALHQFEDGPVLAPSHVFIPGETIFFSCRAGYQMATTGDDSGRELACDSGFDPAGVALDHRGGPHRRTSSSAGQNWLRVSAYLRGSPTRWAAPTGSREGEEEEVGGRKLCRSWMSGARA